MAKEQNRQPIVVVCLSIHTYKLCVCFFLHYPRCGRHTATSVIWLLNAELLLISHQIVSGRTADSDSVTGLIAVTLYGFKHAFFSYFFSGLLLMFSFSAATVTLFVVVYLVLKHFHHHIIIIIVDSFLRHLPPSTSSQYGCTWCLLFLDYLCTVCVCGVSVHRVCRKRQFACPENQLCQTNNSRQQPTSKNKNGHSIDVHTRKHFTLVTWSATIRHRAKDKLILCTYLAPIHDTIQNTGKFVMSVQRVFSYIWAKARHFPI